MEKVYFYLRKEDYVFTPCLLAGLECLQDYTQNHPNGLLQNLYEGQIQECISHLL